MDTTTFLTLCIIGLSAGMLSGLIGVGGGIIIVPALVAFIGLTQHQAQGVSLMLMLPPIGILAVLNYYKGLELNKTFILYAVVMSVLFVIGGYLGSKLSLRLSPNLLKFIFGSIMLYASIRLLISGSKYFTES